MFYFFIIKADSFKGFSFKVYCCCGGFSFTEELKTKKLITFYKELWATMESLQFTGEKSIKMYKFTTF